MQIVVNIPEEEYNIIKNYKAPMTWTEHLIANGTPFPFDIDKHDEEVIKATVESLWGEPCEDAISRQAVIDMLDNAQIITDGEYCGYCTEDIDINILQPVTPQPKIGRWLKGKPECPNCGIDRYQDLDADIYSEWYPNYCPNCGAKMQEVSE